MTHIRGLIQALLGPCKQIFQPIILIMDVNAGRQQDPFHMMFLTAYQHFNGIFGGLTRRKEGHDLLRIKKQMYQSARGQNSTLIGSKWSFVSQEVFFLLLFIE